ncbi:uncharacterized protein LOC117504561 [Thalassophryne amazonica]|uniref:uncharacterized protein LOC117504561 n=1 Tax=Thalassophryne amazonica TaxID=390379 RepID=UPI00147268FF|nr:uncharacterized protein LOC117504561 [Thalassophryne amazonica]
MEEEHDKIKAVSQCQKGSWTSREGVVNRNTSWSNLCKILQARLSFLSCTTYDLLPCPLDLHQPSPPLVSHLTSFPFTGTKPSPGWCVRQWQKTVPSNFSSNISLGENTEFFVSLKTDPVIRGNSQRLNQPPFAALPLPLRAQESCSKSFRLSVKDVDGDRVRCRFASRDQNECITCTQHSFLQLDEETCVLSFTGGAAAGTYFIYLMVEDFIPFPQLWHVPNNKALSDVPMQLSLSVENGLSSCSDRHTVTDPSPRSDSVVYVLPFHMVKISFSFTSPTESILEIPVIGPYELLRYNYTESGSKVTLSVAWVHTQNTLPRLLPICVAANTNSLQSELICVWLYQSKSPYKKLQQVSV